MDCESTGFSLQDVILFLGLQGRTGELVLESGNNIGTMIFHQGRILQAFSPYSRAIGDLLVEDGIITEVELLETLKLQKQNSVSPIGALFLKLGKVSFEVIEMMVQEQIRQSVGEFNKWGKLRLSFVDKSIEPFDRIHLTVHEFITPETFNAARNFFKTAAIQKGKTLTAPASPTVS